MTTQGNRVYCAVENYVRASALNNANDWTTVDDAAEIQINTTDGQLINGLSAGNGHVTVFKPSSMFELYGKGPQSYATEEIASDIGVTGNQATVAYDDSLPFLSRDGIYRYAGGLRPEKLFSVPVQQYINRSNKSQMSKGVAGNDGKYLYFGIPYGGSTENSRILQYDPIHQVWTTWDGIAVTQMVRIGADMYFGDASGRVLRLGGTNDAGTAITATAITKPFTAGSIARKQQWFKIWIVASVKAGSTLSIYISGKAVGEDWILAKTLTPTSDIQYQEMLVPTNTIAAANAVRLKLVATGQVTIHEISRLTREMPMRR
ncbi:hypothetical protein [Paenibacillus gorillae]|uniref:hypothetical protein n=1 Tax=Paenibacillus gorillae TaxID=1243662 RepID=UPI0012DC8C07|nr:hypothetical protein [Paenibacillus gorillae]